MIFYLSGTGNTRWAAETISRATGESLVDISKVDHGDVVYQLSEGERLGFCFPVHGWRPPKLLRNFIGRLGISNPEGHFCFALCTAGDTVGEAVKILNNDLNMRGISIDSAFSLLMPESYVGLPFMDVDTPEKENAKKRRAAEDLERFIKMIENREKGITEVTIGHWPRINSRILGGYFNSRMITDKPFRVTESKCIGCGKCVAACPVGNVLMSESGVPEWQHDGSCLACFACYHHCPTHAIEYGNRTKRKGQYYFKP